MAEFKMLDEAAFKAAVTRGRKAYSAPRATSVRFDRRSGQVMIALNTGITFAFDPKDAPSCATPRWAIWSASPSRASAAPLVAKVECHPGELYPRLGFVVTNLARPAERAVAFYNQGSTAEQWIKEGKNAVKWTRLSCRTMAANALRLQLHALAYNMANFLRTLALPPEMAKWSLTSRREKVVKIGAKVIAQRQIHGLPDGRSGRAA